MSVTATKPVAWHEAKLGEILPLKYGKARSEQFGYPRPETSTFGSNGAFGIFPRALTHGPAILVGRKGAAGTVHYSAEPCWPIDTTFYTEGNDEAFLPFFRYLLESLQLVRLDRSTAIPSLSRDDYDSKIVQYPKTLEEQRRIVSELEKQFTRLEVGVAALRRVQANLKRYRAAVLKAACEGRLVPTEADLAKAGNRKAKFETGEALLTRILTERRKNWQGRGKYKEPLAPDIASLPPLPEGWIWANAEQVTSLVTSGSRGWGEFYSDSGPLFIRAQDIKTDSLKLNGVARVALPEKAEGMRSSVENADLLVTITGANVTKSAIVRNLTEVAFVSQHVALLKPACREVSPFLYLWIVSAAHGRKFLEQWAYGAGKPGLSLEQVRNLPVALPPLPEQVRIVAEVERRLSVVDEVESVVSANLQRATHLRQSILQKAFTGALV